MKKPMAAPAIRKTGEVEPNRARKQAFKRKDLSKALPYGRGSVALVNHERLG
jgi:hypothetical protein